MALIITGCVFDDLFDDCRNAQELAKPSDVGGLIAVGKQAIVADAVKALGEDVHEETADELMGVERHRLPAIGSIEPIVLPAESDAPLAAWGKDRLRFSRVRGFDLS